MPDVFDENGLQTKTLTELREELEANLKSIYGEDINLDQDSPDGQLVGIISQLGVDTRELIEQINAGFDPDQAEGRVLDQRVAINGIKRAGGTYSTTPISITTDRAVNLVGLDSEASELNPEVENLYTVKDDEGNEFYLLSSYSFSSADTQSLEFRAKELGQVLISENTITTPVTITLGVISVNNPTGPSNIGNNEQLDPELRELRRASVAITATGYLDSIEAAIRALDGVVTAIVKENDTNTTDSEGTAPHTIWAIVEGGDEDEIGAAIYAKKSSGSGMRGAVQVDVPRPDGRTFPAKFDRPSNQDLYIRFSLVLPGGVVDADEIKRLIVENVIWGVGEDAVASVVTCYVQGLNPNYQITGMELSDDDATWLEVVSPATSQNRFVNATSRITIT